MATGAMYVKTADETGGLWKPCYPLVKNETGWKRGWDLYQKTNPTTWTLRYNGDTVPPGRPSVNVAGDSSSVTITAAGDADMLMMRMKRSTNGYPANDSADAEFDTSFQPDGMWWSQWWATPGNATVRKVSGYAPGTTVYFTAWAYDTHNNQSEPLLFTVTIPYPPAPPQPVEVVRAAYQDCTHSASWRDVGWRTDNNYVYQGGSYGGHAGMWFYSNRLSSTLSRAVRINRLALYVERVNSQHGISGGVVPNITSHLNENRPAGSPHGTINVIGYLGGGLPRGGAGWYEIPDNGLFEAFRTGYHCGFGLYFGQTSFTDSRYMMAYGGGTASGRVYLEWVERV